LFSWYRETDRRARRVFWTCLMAWGLDAADGLVYQYLIPVIIGALGITLSQAGLIAGVNYFTSALGGWLGGWLCDRYGRARILQFTILWFSIFSALSGFAQSFDQLLTLRALQGLGFGAEWAVGAVLLGELIRPENRGRVLGTVHSAAALGSGVAALLAGPVAAWIGPEYGWRAVLWMGAIPALLVLFIRRGDDDSDIYKEAKRTRAQGAGIAAIFAPKYIGVTAGAALLALGAQGAGFGVSNYLTTFLVHERALTPSTAGYYVLLNSAGGFFGFLLNGWIGDRLGRRATFRIFAVGFVAAVMLYLYAPLGGAGPALAGCGFIYGFFQFGIYASFGPVFTELFPTELRGAGQSFAYNFGRAMSFVFIQGVAILAAHLTLSLSMMTMGMVGATIAFIATFLLPETAGRDLRAVGATVVPDTAETEHAERYQGAGGSRPRASGPAR
jgi:MFS family permease